MNEQIRPVPLTGRTDEAVEFMKSWPTSRMHLWAKVPDGRVEAHTFDRTESGYAAMRVWIDERQGKSNQYFVVNDINVTLGVDRRADPKDGKTKLILTPLETDVTRMVAAQVDVDYRATLNMTDEERITHFQAEHIRIRDLLRSYKLRLNVTVATGGGWQAYHLFNQPIEVNGDATRIAEAKRINIHLKRVLAGSDDCESLQHVMRLPGTVNVLDANKRKRGRTISLAHCVRFDDHDQWHDPGALPKSPDPRTVDEKVGRSRGLGRKLKDDVHPVRGPGVDDLVLELSGGMPGLARELLGAPNESLSTETQLRYGNKGSMAIEVDGPKAGRWYDHEEGVGGGPLELICKCKGLADGAVVNWAREWLGGSGVKDLTPVREVVPESSETPSELDTSGQDADEHQQKVAKILASCREIAGTPGQHYLRSRGITQEPPPCIKFRSKAFDQYGALVALSMDETGQVLAVQQIYLTATGAKAPLPVPKRTNKATEGWANKATVRLPGTQPLVLAEGVETALSIWQATGRETWACLGISNIGRAPVPEGAEVVVARDGDEPGSKADGQIGKAVNWLLRRGHPVSIANPPQGQDFNDVLVKQGQDAVINLINQASGAELKAKDGEAIFLSLGSDVEIATRVRKDLIDQFGLIVCAEGPFWRYIGTQWDRIPDYELRRSVHRYDGAYYPVGQGMARVKLSKGRIDSILNECATLSAEPIFFEKRPVGINCAAGFIRFAPDGSAAIEPHDREHRCRHTLPGRWQPGSDSVPPKGSLLATLLDGVFLGDAEATEKVQLLAQICGSAALGYATQLMQPKAVILFGQTAENGKSQVLDLARGLLPASAVCAVPAGRMGDERHIIGLVGKLLNASDELSAAAVASDTFKSIVTGEPVEGRDVYKSRVEFRSVAQNLFATNNLPPFLGGMDRGVQRRLLVITFNRTIPIEQRIENIGRRIAEEEPDLLLAWAVDGASRLVRQRNFTVPASCKQALNDWILGADPVLAWINECVEIVAVVAGLPSMLTRAAYEQFREWAVAEGFKPDKLPAINGFVQRVQANAKGIEYRRTGKGRQFLGLTIKRQIPF